MPEMTEEERMRVVEATSQWLAICEQEKATPEPYHSALFARLLSGKKALPAPPPLSHSYPWYELIDDGRAEFASLFLWAPREPDEPNALVVMQSRWYIEREVPLDLRDLDDTITYHDARRTPGKWRIRYKGVGVVGRGYDPATNAGYDAMGDLWEIFREEDAP